MGTLWTETRIRQSLVIIYEKFGSYCKIFGRFYEAKFQNYIRAQSACNVFLILWIKWNKDLILHFPNLIAYQTGAQTLNSKKKRKKKKEKCYLLQWKPFKNDEKCFLFHLKSSFRCQDIKWFFKKIVSHVMVY